MSWDRPSSLGKTIEAKASNRPVKIAYLVPFDDSPHTNKNLDAVFFESYTRWGGVYTMVIPTTPRDFLAEGYNEWLKHYDPDFIYTYVDLDPAFVDMIDHLCCPMTFIKHKERKPEDREIDWRSFLPSWDHYIQPVSSVSTIQSPASYPHFPHEERPKEPIIFTQYRGRPDNRFLADNFGTGFNLHNVTYAIPGLFKTLCLVPPDLPDHIVAGTERCISTLEALRAIGDRKAIPIARLAMANSAGMPRQKSSDWASAFRLFIGDTPLDRIHFWNSRLLVSSWSDMSNALSIGPAFFDDEELVKQLGQYLNKNNFLGRNGGPYQAEIHSCSVTADALSTIRDKLQPHTWNTVRVSQRFDVPAVPSQRDHFERIHDKSTDVTALKLTEDSSEIAASEPAHFIYIQPQFRGLAHGQWIVDLSIQRHNNLSRYSNLIDTWMLPRRRKISRAFTERQAKPTIDGHLALVPTIKSFPFKGHAIRDPAYYEIHLPSDEIFFRYLTLEFFRYAADDMRAQIPRAGCIDMAISDKGQNLRGVISLFGDLSIAFGILVKKYWRTVLAQAKVDSTNPLTFDLNKLESLIPNDRGTMQRLTRELHLGSVGVTKSYLRDSLKDTLEYLVHSNVFFNVVHWRCGYCGHLNSRSFDNMRMKNQCDICATEYFAPIDIEWRYELNDFVYRSLQKQSGLPVLLTLGFLQDQFSNGAFWYIPEVDLYDNGDDPQSKNEIDILCMLGGEFYAIEVKRSASIVLNKVGAIDKFVKVIELIRPDVALLSFERYCAEGENVEAMKQRLADTVSDVRKRIGPWTRLEIFVAQDLDSFDHFSADFGWAGHRASRYH